jgi:GNAT superfamily N-acetyltransferase
MISIEPAVSDDTAILVEFQRKMALETENLTLDPHIVNKGVEAIFQDKSKGNYYVAKEQGYIIACLLTTPEWSEWRNGTVLWIQSVYVRPSHRGQGVFRKLYAYIQQIVEDTDGLRGIRLYVDNRNVAAQQVYHALGMNNEHYQLFEWMK